jgi:hypothetical protein
MDHNKVFTLGCWLQQIDDAKKTPTLLAIVVAMRMRQYNAECIAQWITSSTSLEATVMPMEITFMDTED